MLLGQEPMRQGQKARYKNVGIALTLSALVGLFGILGLGHVYLRRRKRGACYVAAGLALLAMGVWLAAFSSGMLALSCFAAYLALWAVQVAEAVKLTRTYNEHVLRTKRAPW